MLLFILCTFGCSTSYAQTFLANNSNGNLISLDINGCTTSTILNIGSYTDIASHPDGFLYAVKSNGQLYRLDSTTGAADLITTFTGNSYYALTADAAGNIFAASGSGNLVSYNPATGTNTNYPNMGYDASGDLTFYQGEMYMATDDNTMVKIDPDNPSNNSVFIDFATANVTIYGIVSTVNDCDVQTYALSNDNSSRIFEIDWENQSFNYVCSVPHKIYGGSSEFEFNASAENIQVADIDIQVDCGDSSADVVITATTVNNSLTYSLNNMSAQSSNAFQNVPFGNNTLLITDDIGCSKTVEFTADPPSNINIDNLQINNIACNQTSGSILIEASSSDGGVMYSLDGINFSTNNFFENLPADDYIITITDNSGCDVGITATIEEFIPIELLNINVSHTSCGENNGAAEIEINSNGNTASFSLDNNSFNSDFIFNNLSTGNYTIYIKDQNNCLIQEEFGINPSSPLILNDISTVLSDCGMENGSVIVDADGGDGVSLNYSLNQTQNTNGIFEDLASGEFQVNISTNTGCEIGPFPISIGDPCGIYIPNTFSPNEDGFNDFFKLYSPANVWIEEFLIFNRWGELVHSDGGYSSDDFTRGWHGEINNKKAPTGVYVYLLRVLKNGEEEFFTGDITLIN